MPTWRNRVITRVQETIVEDLKWAQISKISPVTEAKRNSIDLELHLSALKFSLDQIKFWLDLCPKQIRYQVLEGATYTLLPP
jgi:hypothetical protein